MARGISAEMLRMLDPSPQLFYMILLSSQYSGAYQQSPVRGITSPVNIQLSVYYYTAADEHQPLP